MKRGQVFVRAQDENGKWQSIDVLDLDDESFRVFVVNMLMRGMLVTSITDENVDGEQITLRARPKASI